MVIAADSPHRAPSLLPELENGETLNAAEFLHRYERSPQLGKVQLIEGRVFMPSPVRADYPSAYRRNGIAEYLMWLTREDRVIWFALENGEFQPLAADSRGALTSRRFPGLSLEVVALLARDGAAVLAGLQKGLATRVSA